MERDMLLLCTVCLYSEVYLYIIQIDIYSEFNCYNQWVVIVDKVAIKLKFDCYELCRVDFISSQIVFCGSCQCCVLTVDNYVFNINVYDAKA